MPSFPGQRAVIGSQRGMSSAYLGVSLFPWGNTPVPYIWVPAYKLTGFNNGDAVATWKDQSGNSRDLSSSPGAVYTTSGGPSSKPFLQFTSSSYTVPPLSALTSVDIFLIYRNNTANTGNGIYTLSDTAPATFLPFNSDSNYYDSFCAQDRQGPFVGPSVDTWHVYEAQSTNGGWSASLDRTELFSTASNTFAGPASGVIGTGSGFNYGGKIADIILFSSILSSGDRAKILNWCSSQYGTA